MLGFLSSLNQMRSQAKSFKHQATLHNIAATAATTQANAQAALIQFQSNQQQEIANRNLRTARENQRAAEGTARTHDAASGFTTAGTGNTHARRAKLEADAAIQNMALSASIASHNAWQRATDTIRQGRVTAMQHEAQAEQYHLASKATRDSMLWTGISAAAGAAVGGIAGYLKNRPTQKQLDEAQDVNNTLFDAYQRGIISEADYLNNIQGFNYKPLEQTLAGAYQGLNTAAGAANAFNPWTATMTPAANNRKNNWGANLSVLLGRTPYTTPQAGNLFPGI